MTHLIGLLRPIDIQFDLYDKRHRSRLSRVTLGLHPEVDGESTLIEQVLANVLGPGQSIEGRSRQSYSLILPGLGGPIIKNKLHFFVNAEMQRDATPQPFSLDTYNGDATAAQLNEL